MLSENKILWLFLMTALTMLCCKDNDPIEEIIEEVVEVKDIFPNGSEQYLNENSDYLFNQDSLYTYELIIPESNYDHINRDPAKEEYVEGQLVFQGDTISPVGIRYKGSIGAFVNCLSSDDWANPEGRKTCTKLSMKIKINWEDREDKFYDLNKLQFHSMNNDLSQMRERLGYHLFRAMDTPAPRAVHARLKINGEFNGLFAFVEQIDGRFVKHNFDDDDGNLYKELWPLTNQNSIHSDHEYFSSLKTNEDESPNFDIIKDFGREVIQSSDEDLQEVLNKYLDIQEILRYSVVDRMIRHDDGPFHWYCNSNNCSSHNFYWYEEPTNKKLHLIAWDLDNAFENIINPANPVTPIADEWGEISNNCQPFVSGFLGLEQWSASCDKITGHLASIDAYDSIKQNFKDNQFSNAEVSGLIENWSQQIRSSTIEAAQLNNDAVSFELWQLAIGELNEQCDFALSN